jgi:hypothetical protein
MATTQFLEVKGIFLFFITIRLVLVLSSRVHKLEHEAGQLLPSGVEVKTAWRFTSDPLYIHSW